MSYTRYSRSEWASLPKYISQDSITHLPNLLSDIELDAFYIPLASFIGILYRNHLKCKADLQHFFNKETKAIPFLVGVAGSVSAGKSTFSESIAQLFEGLPGSPKTTIVSTDQFLYKNEILEARELKDLKGFPESYDWKNLLHTLQTIKSGKSTDVPIYSHETYDILPDETQHVESPDILIVEGINTLQVGINGEDLPSLFDISLYLDAEEEDLFSWFWTRILQFKEKAKEDPSSYYHAFKDMPEEQLHQMAKTVWDTINGKNLREHILPTKEKADIIVKKASDHTINEIQISETLL
ncbi:type I pantothenate kinase [Pullulanibacillus pueri]|uniref:Pantothenate kinase n=1 Tax=Pullulanibacillus pueri TaxID=1437324 RepID=A0A8J3ENR0_9BACL|nr:type I pantothenate kinase [Pullulanibacillus pueri]MBM7684238.1 type I pantothenate kinase [Pullulanibacillus pueri]GGH87468.1 pantothenate kinase [Pullulanibacillus pueri]